MGKHDFKAFQASDRVERDSVRKVMDVNLVKNGTALIFEIEGDGFLYNMVRNIVGTLVDAGRGYLAPGSFKSILKSRDRTLAGPTAPPEGLFLVKVRY